MLPVIALVGRPNVGKSTLFNFLTRTRDALVADLPGLTRDRNYGYGKVGSQPYLVVDTGGLVVLCALPDQPALRPVKCVLAEPYRHGRPRNSPESIPLFSRPGPARRDRMPHRSP